MGAKAEEWQVQGQPGLYRERLLKTTRSLVPQRSTLEVLPRDLSGLGRQQPAHTLAMDSYVFSGTLPISCWDLPQPAFSMSSCPVWLCLLITLPTILLGQPLPEMCGHQYVPERQILQPSAKPQRIPGPLHTPALGSCLRRPCAGGGGGVLYTGGEHPDQG